MSECCTVHCKNNVQINGSLNLRPLGGEEHKYAGIVEIEKYKEGKRER